MDAISLLAIRLQEEYKVMGECTLSVKVMTLVLAVAGKFQRFQRPHGIPRKTDSDNNILLADSDNLLEYLAGSIGIDYRHVPLADQIPVKTQEISQRAQHSDADHIDPSGIENGIHRKFKHFMINGCHGHLDLLNIRLQDGCK